MNCFLFLLIVGYVSAECTRPTDYHWLIDSTPTNTSIKLFSGNSGSVERIYFDFAHSQCYRPNGGDYIVHCNEKTMSLPCQNSPDPHIQLGLGQNSALWHHYQHMEFDSQRIILSTEEKTYSESCETLNLPVGLPVYFCMIDNVKTHWVYKGATRHMDMHLQMFSDNERTIIPTHLYQVFEEAVKDERYDDIYLIFELNGKIWKCGRDCLWTDSFAKGFELWVQSHPNDDNLIMLNERFLHYKTIKYSAWSRTIEFDDKDVFIKREHKFAVQLILLPKIFYGFWAFTRKKENHKNPKQQELFYEIADIIALALITLEELLMHNNNAMQSSVVATIVSWIVFVKVYEYGVHDKDAEKNFEAAIVVGKIIPIFIFQTILQELDSYECVVIALFIQSALIINEFFEVILFFKREHQLEFLLRFLFSVFLWFVLIGNHSVWLSVFFDEIVSLLGYDKPLLIICFYTIILVFVVEVWKRREIFNKVKFL